MSGLWQSMVDVNIQNKIKNNHRKDKVLNFDYQIYLRAANIRYSMALFSTFRSLVILLVLHQV